MPVTFLIKEVKFVMAILSFVDSSVTLEFLNKCRLESVPDIMVDPDLNAGQWGGQCLCPNGKTYWVGDNMNSCKSLACGNGTPISCFKYDDPKWRNKSVQCSIDDTSKDTRNGCVHDSITTLRYNPLNKNFEMIIDQMRTGKGLISRQELKDFIMQVEFRVAPISYGSDYKIKYHPYYLVSLKPKDYSNKTYPFLKIPFSISSNKDDDDTQLTRPVALRSSKSMSEIFIRYHESVYWITTRRPSVKIKNTDPKFALVCRP